MDTVTTHVPDETAKRGQWIPHGQMLIGSFLSFLPVFLLILISVLKDVFLIYAPPTMAYSLLYSYTEILMLPLRIVSCFDYLENPAAQGLTIWLSGGDKKLASLLEVPIYCMIPAFLCGMFGLVVFDMPTNSRLMRCVSFRFVLAKLFRIGAAVLLAYLSYCVLPLTVVFLVCFLIYRRIRVSAETWLESYRLAVSLLLWVVSVVAVPYVFVVRSTDGFGLEFQLTSVSVYLYFCGLTMLRSGVFRGTLRWHILWLVPGLITTVYNGCLLAWVMLSLRSGFGLCDIIMVAVLLAGAVGGILLCIGACSVEGQRPVGDQRAAPLWEDR